MLMIICRISLLNRMNGIGNWQVMVNWLRKLYGAENVHRKQMMAARRGATKPE